MVPLSDPTAARLRSLFRPGDRAAAAALLESHCGENLPFCEAATPESSERIRFAALKVSGGDLGKLRAAVEHAAVDWRDVLMWAGFSADPEAHHRWWP